MLVVNKLDEGLYAQPLALQIINITTRIAVRNGLGGSMHYETYVVAPHLLLVCHCSRDFARVSVDTSNQCMTKLSFLLIAIIKSLDNNCFPARITSVQNNDNLA